ncbi:MAG: hypothetical protein AAF610_03665 [Pseudomonadota bacterium]
MTAVRGVDPSGMRNGEAGPGSFRDNGEVLVVAPQFITEGDYAGPGALPNNVLRWSARFWGENALNGGKPSSFHVLDEIIRHLCDRSRFAQIERIVLVGHSGGGQILNRYAAAGRGEDLYAIPAGIRVRYIPMNAGSYQYFSPQRPVNTSERTFAPPPLGVCIGYDNWGYGLSGPLLDYHATHSLGVNELQAQYRQRDVVYLIGDEDNDPGHASLPSGCAGNLQGAHRLARSRAYFNHLVQHFGRDLMRRQQNVVIPGADHSGGKMLRSPITRRFLLEPFGDRAKLVRRGGVGTGGKVTRIAALRHWDHPSNGSDNQAVTAVRTGNGRLKLISWRAFDDGTFIRSGESATTPHAALSIGLTRVVRDEYIPPSIDAVDRQAYVTAYTTGSDLRVAAWDADAQGGFQAPVMGPLASMGAANLARLTRLSGARFVTVQRNRRTRLTIKLWRVDDTGKPQLLTSLAIPGSGAERVQLVRRGSTRVVVVAQVSGGLRVIHVSASQAQVAPATLTIDYDKIYGAFNGDQLCAVMATNTRMVVGLRDATTQKLRMVTIVVTSTGSRIAYDNQTDTGKIGLGLSAMRLGRYGVCFAVRTRAGKAKLLFYRLSPEGVSRRVADTGSSFGNIKRHHALADAGLPVGDDIVFAYANDAGNLCVQGVRYTS